MGLRSRIKKLRERLERGEPIPRAEIRQIDPKPLSSREIKKLSEGLDLTEKNFTPKLVKKSG